MTRTRRIAVLVLVAIVLCSVLMFIGFEMYVGAHQVAEYTGMSREAEDVGIIMLAFIDAKGRLPSNVEELYEKGYLVRVSQGQSIAGPRMPEAASIRPFYYLGHFRIGSGDTPLLFTDAQGKQIHSAEVYSLAIVDHMRGLPTSNPSTSPDEPDGR